MLSVVRYSIKSDCLKPWVKFIWQFEAANAKINHTLLPTDSIDLILNFSGNITYKTKFNSFIAPKFHFNGLRDKICNIQQTGKICVLGISFYSFGLYPFINRSLEQIQNQIIPLHTFSTTLDKMFQSIIPNNITEDTIALIEKILCSEFRIEKSYMQKAQLIRKFTEADNTIKIKKFCDEFKINQKTFERMFLRYCGYTPKKLLRLKRFQSASNHLVHQKPQNLSEIAYDNDFTDQAHFIKEFKNFTGAAPTWFLSKKASVKENVKYDYM